MVEPVKTNELGIERVCHLDCIQLCSCSITVCVLILPFKISLHFNQSTIVRYGEVYEGVCIPAIRASAALYKPLAGKGFDVPLYVLTPKSEIMAICTKR